MRSLIAWTTLPQGSLAELAHEVAGLPSELEAEDEEAKRFDVLILNFATRCASARSPSFSDLVSKSKLSRTT